MFLWRLFSHLGNLIQQPSAKCDFGQERLCREIQQTLAESEMRLQGESDR